MTMMLFPMLGNERMTNAIAERIGSAVGKLELRRFPDGESYIRLHSTVAGRAVAVVCTLAHPDDRFLQLLFTARLLRENGARSVHLVAPYLAYLRQDRRFNDGEALTSRQFAQLLSAEFDGLVTVDPHLHRYGNLQEVYSIETEALAASPLLAEWISRSCRGAAHHRSRQRERTMGGRHRRAYRRAACGVYEDAPGRPRCPHCGVEPFGLERTNADPRR